MHINSNFDSGNIIVKGRDNENATFHLDIRKDNDSHFYQWFHFRLTGAINTKTTMIIQNAGGAAFVDGWDDYKTVASYDRENWFRVPTTWDGENLTLCHTPEQNSVWYAYFAPYSMERHFDLIGQACQNSLVSHQVLGRTLDGQDIDMLTIEKSGGEAEKLNCWIGARQHPGESMAEWWIEGALALLLDANNPTAASLLKTCRFHIIPNINPDGSKRGHLRTNAAGVNLNREWADPSMEKSPEVFLVRQAMHNLGCDFHMDVHGDEAIPHNFTAGYESIPSLTPNHQALYEKYQNVLNDLTDEFQTEHGYGLVEAGTSDLKKCTDYVAEAFGCLAMTLEMPFKDHDDNPNAEQGWSPERSKALAIPCLVALEALIGDIKAHKAS